MSYCSSIASGQRWKLCPRNQLHFFIFLYLKSACRSLQSCQGSRNFSDVWLAHWSGSGGSSDGISVYALAALMCLVQTLDIPNCFTMFHILHHSTIHNVYCELHVEPLRWQGSFTPRHASLLVNVGPQLDIRQRLYEFHRHVECVNLCWSVFIIFSNDHFFQRWIINPY